MRDFLAADRGADQQQQLPQEDTKNKPGRLKKVRAEDETVV